MSDLNLRVLAELLSKAAQELRQHNDDYHHVTHPDLVIELEVWSKRLLRLAVPIGKPLVEQSPEPPP